MKTALVIGNGQIGSEIAAQLIASGSQPSASPRAPAEVRPAPQPERPPPPPRRKPRPRLARRLSALPPTSGPTRVIALSWPSPLRESMRSSPAHTLPMTVGDGSKSSPGSMRRFWTPPRTSASLSSSRSRSTPSPDCAPRSPNPPRSLRWRTRDESGSGSSRPADAHSATQRERHRRGSARQDRREVVVGRADVHHRTECPPGAGPWCRHGQTSLMESPSSPTTRPQ
jgi:hypothetical protein